MDPSLSLRDATVQEIQLELLRRTQFNAMDGERIAASLLRHRDLWIAALLDRPGLPDFTNPRRLLMSGLIKLRDLSENFWNVDILYVLTRSAKEAHALLRIAEDEEWGGMPHVIEDREEVDRALGGGDGEEAVLRVWWD